MEGWISLQRKMQSHWLWEEDRCFSKAEAWIDLLLSVNHKPNKIVIKNKVISVKRGQTAMSLVTLAKRWKWDKSKVRRFLELLKSDSMIDTKNETVTTLITICNYESYQSNGNANETDSKRKRNASETHSTPNNNDNNDKNDKKLVLTECPSDKIEYLNNWIDYRLEIKKPIRQKTVDSLIKRFKEHTTKEIEYVIENSISNNWQGLFWDKLPNFNQKDIFTNKPKMNRL